MKRILLKIDVRKILFLLLSYWFSLQSIFFNNYTILQVLTTEIETYLGNDCHALNDAATIELSVGDEFQQVEEVDHD